MGSHSIRCVILLLVSAALTSCGATMARYATESDGYWVARGKIVRIENLSAKDWNSLGSGLRAEVHRAGCRITLEYGDRTQVFEPGPGSVLLFGPKGDYILQPFENQSSFAAATDSTFAPTDPDWAAAGVSGNAGPGEQTVLDHGEALETGIVAGPPAETTPR
jgi:hypothetical protein